MSSLHNSSSATVREPSAAIAAQVLRERIGQENVTQSSVLASRRLDEALLRLEQASLGKRMVPPQAERTLEPAPTGKSERPPASVEPWNSKRVDTDANDSTSRVSEMSPDAIEALFGEPIDVMIRSSKAKIAAGHVLKPEVASRPVVTSGPAVPLRPAVAPRPASAPHRAFSPSAEVAVKPMVAPTSTHSTSLHPQQSVPFIDHQCSSTPITSARVSVTPRDVEPADSKSPRDFVAAWQVDEFVVPSTVDQLFLADSMAEQLAARLAEARTDGLQIIAVTSAKSGEGRSTVAMGLALSIAFSGLRVALVDADRHGVKIATDLQLDLDQSWAEAIREHLPLEEVAVTSQADSLTLMPLLERDGGADFEPAELNKMLVRLRESFDMIVVDCGPSAIEEIILCGTALIVHDVQRTGAAELEVLSHSLRSGGVRGIGVIENFCV